MDGPVHITERVTHMNRNIVRIARWALLPLLVLTLWNWVSFVLLYPHVDYSPVALAQAGVMVFGWLLEVGVYAATWKGN